MPTRREEGEEKDSKETALEGARRTRKVVLGRAGPYSKTEVRKDPHFKGTNYSESHVLKVTHLEAQRQSVLGRLLNPAWEAA